MLSPNPAVAGKAVANVPILILLLLPVTVVLLPLTTLGSPNAKLPSPVTVLPVPKAPLLAPVMVLLEPKALEFAPVTLLAKPTATLFELAAPMLVWLPMAMPLASPMQRTPRCPRRFFRYPRWRSSCPTGLRLRSQSR